MQINKEIEAWLYPNLPTNCFPQRVYAGAKKNVLAWLPGNKPFVPPNPAKVALIGYTGKAFPMTAETQEGAYTLHWLGIDLDDILEPVRASESIAKLLPQASVRLSTGGHGLHVITRIKPVELIGNATGLVKAVQADWVETLLKAGFSVCKFDSRVFFLHGGRNTWLHQIFCLYEIPAELVPATKDNSLTARGSKKTHAWYDLKPRIQAFLKVAFPNDSTSNIYPEYTDIYVKEMHARLENTRYTFKTKSKMLSTEKHTNGYIRVTPTYACLKAFADDKPALEIFDFLAEQGGTKNEF